MLPPRRRKRRLRPLEDASNAIYRALCKAGLTDQAKRLRIFQRWAEAVGPEIAARTTPQMFSRGVLIIKAASPTWQNELMFLKSSILVRLNELLGTKQVHELKVISGHVPHPGAVEPGWRKPLPTPADYVAARAMAQPIADPEVRAAFERLLVCDFAKSRSK